MFVKFTTVKRKRFQKWQNLDPHTNTEINTGKRFYLTQL